MRPLAGLAIALGCCSGTQAAAQAAPIRLESTSPLLSAAFAPRADRAPAPAYDPFTALLAADTYREGEGLVVWNVNQITVAKPDRAAVDTLRISVAGPLRTPGGLPLNLDRAEFDAQAYEVAFTRDWPGAMRFGAGAYDVALTPHAGLGVGSDGGSAEAGATLTLGQKLDSGVASRLGAMGVRDGAVFGEEGRWYLFAAASGRAVGLNMQRQAGVWDRAGWSTDAASTLIGDAQLGFGWRKGAMQTSFGLIHRKVKGEHMLMGQDTKDDSLVAISLSIRPRR